MKSIFLLTFCLLFLLSCSNDDWVTNAAIKFNKEFIDKGFKFYEDGVASSNDSLWYLNNFRVLGLSDKEDSLYYPLIYNNDNSISSKIMEKLPLRFSKENDSVIKFGNVRYVLRDTLYYPLK